MKYTDHDITMVIRNLQKVETSNPWVEKLAKIVEEIYKDVQELKSENYRLKSRIYNAETHFKK